MGQKQGLWFAQRGVRFNPLGRLFLWRGSSKSEKFRDEESMGGQVDAEVFIIGCYYQLILAQKLRNAMLTFTVRRFDGSASQTFATTFEKPVPPRTCVVLF